MKVKRFKCVNYGGGDIQHIYYEGIGYKCSKCEMIIFYYGEKGEKILKEKEENGER